MSQEGYGVVIELPSEVDRDKLRLQTERRVLDSLTNHQHHGRTTKPEPGRVR